MNILTLWATVNNPVRMAPGARPGHRLQVDDASVMPDGERGVTSSRDGVFRVWHLASGQLHHEIDTTFEMGQSPAFTDRSRGTTRPESGLGVRNIDSGESFPFESERAAAMSAFAVDRDGVRGISGDADGNATIWDLQVGEPIFRLTCRAGMLTAVDMSSDGWTAATGSVTGDVILWDVSTGLPLHRLSCPGTVCALALSPCGKRIIVGDHASLSVYAIPDVSQPPPIARLITRTRVTAVALNPAFPSYVLCGTASGQVAYVRIP
jgi:WD40 repeat protein